MIEFTKSFKVGDKVFATIEEAQFVELRQMFPDAVDPNASPTAAVENFIQTLISKSDEVIDILSTTPSSRPRARSRNGGKKTRKATTIQASETAA